MSPHRESDRPYFSKIFRRPVWAPFDIKEGEPSSVNCLMSLEVAGPIGASPNETKIGESDNATSIAIHLPKRSELIGLSDFRWALPSGITFGQRQPAWRDCRALLRACHDGSSDCLTDLRQAVLFFSGGRRRHCFSEDSKAVADDPHFEVRQHPKASRSAL